MAGAIAGVPGSFDEYRAAPDGRRPLDQAKSAWTASPPR